MPNVLVSADIDVFLRSATFSAARVSLGAAPTSHTHGQSEISGLPEALSTKSEVGHVHPISDVTNLQTTLDGKVSLTGNQSIAGNKTFSGQVDLSSAQTLANANSVITRDLFQVETMFAANIRDIVGAATLVTSGSGFATLYDHNSVLLNGSITASAWQRAALTRFLTNNPAWSGATGVLRSHAFAFTFMMQSAAALINTELRFVVGDANAGAPPAFGGNRLTTAGYGFVIYYSTINARFEIKLFFHNGSVYTESAGAVFPNVTDPSSRMRSIIVSYSAADIKLYNAVAATDNNALPRPSNTPLQTLVTGSSPTLGQSYASFVIVNGAVAPVGVMDLLLFNTKYQSSLVLPYPVI